MNNKYRITIKNSEESSIRVQMPNGSVQDKDVATKSLLNSFSLEQKLISFGFISPGVIKHRKKGGSYDIAVLLPHRIVGEDNKKKFILPQCIALIRTNANFSSLSKVQLFQVVGMGYRGANTEIVEFPYQYEPSQFGSGFSKDAYGIVYNKLEDMAKRFISEERVKFSNGQVLSLKDYYAKHKDSVLLDASLCHTSKLTLTNVFGQF